MEMWPREVCANAEKSRAMAVLDALSHPSEQELNEICNHWCKKFYLTVDEAAALLMGWDPIVLEGYQFLAADLQAAYRQMVDLIRRRFPNQVSPADLREYVTTTGIANNLPWPVMHNGSPPDTKPVRASDEKRKQKTKDKILLGIALEKGYRPDRSNTATGMIKNLLDRKGIPLDEDTIRSCLSELAADPDLAKFVTASSKDGRS
jgi:hypothetical protein